MNACSQALTCNNSSSYLGFHWLSHLSWICDLHTLKDLFSPLQMSGHKYGTCLIVPWQLRCVSSSGWGLFEFLNPSHSAKSFPAIPIQRLIQVCYTKSCFEFIKQHKSDFATNEHKVEENAKINNTLLCWEDKKKSFPSSLSDRTADRLQLSWWWIPLWARIWQVFVGNIILSASPVGSLQMQIPDAAVFYDTCSCFPGRPRQVSRRGLANQDGKTRDGRTGRPAQLSALSLVSLHAPPLLAFPPDHSSAICAPISHFHSPIPLPFSLSQC